MQLSVRLAALLLVLFSAPLAAQSIALVSDLNGRYGSVAYHERIDAAVQAVVALQPDLVISTGDMVAGQRRRLDAGDLERMWSAFNRTVSDPLARAGIPFAVTPGNHDGSAFPEYAVEQERFAAQWAGRAPELQFLPGSEWPRRYAARMAGLLLIAFDGTRPGTLPDAERDFVARMLALHGAGVGATVVFSHLPMWPLAAGREHEIIDDAELLQTLHANGVDVYASGHHHVFFAGTDSAGMLHLGVGALGGNARRFPGQPAAQPYSLALLELAGGAVRVEARAAPDFSAPVPHAGLPERINGPLGALRRADGPVPLRR